jgi:tetratricopeptide (TPR) repeat protein
MSDDQKHRGRIFLHRGQLMQAKFAYEQAVADDRLAKDAHALSDSLGNLGNVCALSGDLARAESCYREVLTIQRTEQNQHAIAHTLVNLGNLHIGTDHPKKALPYYLEALDLLRTLKDDRALGILHNNLALQEAREGQWEQAVTSFEALDHHRIVGNEEGLAVTYSQLGKCFLDQSDLTKAERCLNNASEHYIKLGNEPAEAAVLRLLATIYDTRQDFVSARRCLERVVSLDLRYKLSEFQTDSASLAKLKQSG